MNDLKAIGQIAKDKASMEAVREVYDKLKDDEAWLKKNRTSKLWLIAAELNATHTTVAKYLAMQGIEI